MKVWRKGFTLIELMVAIGLFSVLISIAVGGFVTALRTQRQAASLLSVNSNASLAIEQMAREIRTGVQFCGGAPCSSDYLFFRNALGRQVQYCVQNGSVERRESSGMGTPPCGTGGFEEITPTNVDVRYLSFLVTGNTVVDNFPTRVTISIGVSPKEPGVSENVINLQTTISGRVLEDT